MVVFFFAGEGGYIVGPNLFGIVFFKFFEFKKL